VLVLVLDAAVLFFLLAAPPVADREEPFWAAFLIAFPE
jgi:hypothetical protein